MDVVHMNLLYLSLQGFFEQFWGKAPVRNWEKMIDLTSKFGEIYDIEHNKGSKIYPLNQPYAKVFKYHSDMGHCFS